VVPGRASRSLVALACVAFAAPPARAGGFAVPEQGARALGLGGAYVAQSDDATAVFHNAAGLGFLKGKQLSLGASLLHRGTDFVGAAPFPGDALRETGAHGLRLPPTFDYAQRLTPKLVAGVGLHVPFDMRSRWSNRETSYSGRFLVKSASISSASLNPTLAYQLADRLAVGAGLDVRLTQLELERNAEMFNPFTQRVQDVAALRLHSERRVSLGYNVGVLAKPAEGLAIGAAYRHGLRADLTGSAEVSLIATSNSQFDTLVARSLSAGKATAATSLALPALLSVGAQYGWRDWLLSAQWDLQRWSSFAALPLTVDGTPELSESLRLDLTNSQVYRVGVERRLTDTLTLRGGYFLDRTPVPVETLGPLFPEATRHGAAVGASWRRGRMRIEAANALGFSKQRSSEGRNRDDYEGSYRGFSETFSVSLGWWF
jgi:long-chain fatty acid transport protein